MGAMKPQAQAATLTQKEGQSPFFSVIVPVYNVAPYLGECLDSVLAQTFADWECLCTDDGSKDGSDLILDAYARRDLRFRIVHQPNAGVSAARNRALDCLHGQWVGFLDGDDCYSLEALAKVVDIIRAESIKEFDFVKWGYHLLGRPSGVRSGKFNFLPRDETIRFFIDKMIASGMICGGVVRSNCLHGVRFPIGISMCEDMCFFARACASLRGMVLLDWCAYSYRIHPRQSMQRRGIRKLHDQLLAFRLAYNYYLQIVSGQEKYVRRLREVLAQCVATEVTMHACYHGGGLRITHEVCQFLREVPLTFSSGWRSLCVRLMCIPILGELVCCGLALCGGLRKMLRD